MKTNDLIDALSRTSEPAPRSGAAWTIAVLLGLCGALALLLLLGPRADLQTAIAPTLAKASLSAAFAAAALALVLRLARPGRPSRARLWWLAGLIAASFAAAAIALIGVEPGARWQAWTSGFVPWCVVIIPFLALPAALALGAVVKRFAPTELTLTGAAIGAAAGGLGAMAYSLRCPVDSVSFVTTWYAVAIALSAVIGALAGSRLLRW